jgi:asparagine synthase (glutamine-hydrolysing)
MCGIAGMVALDAPRPTEQELGAMAQTLHHRGPDEQGMLLRDRVGLVMRRLSVIDVASGSQPAFNEDRSVAVICNGEIYNYRDLRRQLQAKGHVFRSESDTEVLAHLWEEKGPACTDELNGMFALAVYDMNANEVVLIRDHLGIKPLFYAKDGANLVFGSEVKALLASGRVPRTLDVSAVGQFLAWEYVPGARTLLRDVRKLEPGQMLRLNVKNGACSLKRYWDIPTTPNGAWPNPLSDGWGPCVQAQLDASVRQQLVSDVPLGAFLSGGVDSSLVVAAMGKRSRTFSIGFDDPSYNELPWARQVATHLGVDHVEDTIRPHVEDLFDHLMQFMDDPIGDFSIFPTYLVSRHARQHVTVALSGDGGDELFGGYETYQAQSLATTWQRIPDWARHHTEALLRTLPPTRKKKGLINKARRFAEGLGQPPELGHARWRIFMGQSLCDTLFTADARRQMCEPIESHIIRLDQRAGDVDDLTRALYIDAKSYLPDNCLVKMDRMSMANSLEARVPLLDKDLVSLAFAVPASYKVGHGETKRLLKALARQKVPRTCVDRSKEGFSIPMKHWLCGAFHDRLEELLAPSRLEGEGIFEPATIEQLKCEHLQGRANHSHVLWSLMVFEDWRQRWGV